MRRKYNVCWHIQKDRARSWESAIIPQEPGRSIRKHPTGRAYADAALEMIDRLTRGHADWFQRAFSYLLIYTVSYTNKASDDGSPSLGGFLGT
jgi:hypothetical protein